MTTSKIASHFAELLDVLPDVLAWVKDRQGRYLWVNRAFLVQYALDHPGENDFVTVESIRGKTDYNLSPAFLADQFRHDDEQVLAGHRIINRLERLGEAQGTSSIARCDDFGKSGGLPISRGDRKERRERCH